MKIPRVVEQATTEFRVCEGEVCDSLVDGGPVDFDELGLRCVCPQRIWNPYSDHASLVSPAPGCPKARDDPGSKHPHRRSGQSAGKTIERHVVCHGAVEADRRLCDCCRFSAMDRLH